MKYFFFLLIAVFSFCFSSCSTRFKTTREITGKRHWKPSKNLHKKKKKIFVFKRRKGENRLSRTKARKEGFSPDPFGRSKRLKRYKKYDSGISHKPKQKSKVSTKKTYSKTKRRFKFRSKRSGKEDNRLLKITGKKTKKDRRKNMKRSKKGLFGK